MLMVYLITYVYSYVVNCCIFLFACVPYRASMLERHRRQLEDRLREQGLEYETILRKINREVDILVQILSDDKEDRYKAVITPTKDVTGKPQNWLADIKVSG